MQVKTRLKLFPNFSIHHPSLCWLLPVPTFTHLHTHTHMHTHTHTLPLPFGVGDEYSRRNQGERNPSGLLELICQVGDPPIPVFNYLMGSCLSSACAFSVSQAMASSSKCILQWYSCLLFLHMLTCTHVTKLFADALQSNDACSYTFIIIPIMACYHWYHCE